MEQMEQFIPVTPESEADRMTLLRNTMQFELASRHGEDLEYFADTHGLDFKLLVEKDASILDNFEKDPEATLEKVEKEIYH